MDGAFKQSSPKVKGLFMKTLYAAFISTVFFVMVGCTQPSAQLHSQGSSSLEVTASFYEVAVSIGVKAKDQKVAGSQLAQKLAPMEAWAYKQHGDNWVLKTSQLHPVYIYPQGKGRQLQGYEARKRFILKGLDKQEYEQAMQTLAGFGVSELSLSRVYASEQQLEEAQALLLSQAFNKAKEKALYMAKLSQLCDVTVLDFKEYSQNPERPKLMRRESAMADQGAKARQSLQTRVEVSWQATACL